MAIKVASFQNWNIEGIIDEINQPDIKAVLYFFSPVFEKNEPHGISVAQALSKAFPGAACIGASMIGGWSSTGSASTGNAGRGGN